MHWSHRRGLGEYVDVSVTAENYISTLLKMCHKLMYAKFGVLEWCRCHMKKSSEINKRIYYIFEIYN